MTGYDGLHYNVGDRVELHPRLDMWMKGARFGVVTKVEKSTRAKAVYVKLDLTSREFRGKEDSFKRID